MFAAASLTLIGFANSAFANDVEDRTQAIRLCRAEVSARAGVVADEVRLDQARVRPRLVRVDLDVWTNGQLQNIRCDVQRGDTLEIADITPTLQTAQAAAR
jgi:hypothetical protein